MLDVKIYNSPVKPTWCPGCGDYGILNAVKAALAQLEILPHEVAIFTGIGCGSKLPDYMTVTAFTTIHGRPIPVATGAKLANPKMHILVVAGDGDTYGIGANHFIQALRRNPDITLIVENNMVYGLTKGQYAPTSQKGMVTSTTPEGAIEVALNPLAMAITGGATFVARGFSGDPKHLAWLIAEAIKHKGFSLVDVLQPCVVYNKVQTYDFYRERVYKLEEEGWDPTDRKAAWEKAHEWGDRIPIGIFYRVEGVPTYEDQVPALREGALTTQPVGLDPQAFEALLNEFA
ncbi:MAG: 2-oxoacid:ferredoxin oxidoreductase subunit beta [Armatimonadota bacterium]|nr:2-oxoacid:ferredoxin oxidoreductase subunit beta [Armatimonadota bacterium]MDR5703136.1 2-oxoacid:ferredoxin oxidoreductase subunit beta [Armatimonadota bacterium]